MFHLACRQASIILLSSLGFWALESQSTRNLSLGYANIQTVTVTKDGKSTIRPEIVVSVSDEQSKVRSFGTTNETGILVMPLPVGRYCYDAFSDTGKALTMVRKPADRCFSVKRDEIVNVGVEIVD
jgi:hypothetical protein